MSSITTPAPAPVFVNLSAHLSDKQNRTVLGEAARRVKAEAKARTGRHLRRLDRIHLSGCRTRQPRWDALAAIIEPVLTRLDLATLVLGWLDTDGQFRLNRQRGLAEAAGLTDSRVSRTLTALEAAGYVRRKQRRLFAEWGRWITRTTIHLRPRFFIDLGLGHLLAKARDHKKAQRVTRLESATAKRQAQRLNELATKSASKARYNASQKAAAARQVRVADDQAVSSRQAWAALLTEALAQNPELTPAQVRATLPPCPPQ